MDFSSVRWRLHWCSHSRWKHEKLAVLLKHLALALQLICQHPVSAGCFHSHYQTSAAAAYGRRNAEAVWKHPYQVHEQESQKLTQSVKLHTELYVFWFLPCLITAPALSRLLGVGSDARTETRCRLSSLVIFPSNDNSIILTKASSIRWRTHMARL